MNECPLKKKTIQFLVIFLFTTALCSCSYARTADLHLDQGWNLKCLPCAMGTTNSTFSSFVAGNVLFYWNGTEYETNLDDPWSRPEKVFWIYSPQEADISFQCDAATFSFSRFFALKSGWNLIGNSFQLPVPKNKISIIENFSSYSGDDYFPFGYYYEDLLVLFSSENVISFSETNQLDHKIFAFQNGKYVEVDSVEPGMGVWVYVLNDLLLMLNFDESDEIIPIEDTYDVNSTRTRCDSDFECYAGGCGGEFCCHYTDFCASTCDHFPPPSDFQCGCYMNQCTWYRIQSSSE